LGLKKNKKKQKKIVKKEEKKKLEHKKSSKWMTMLYKGRPCIQGGMKYVVIVGCQLTFNYAS